MSMKNPLTPAGIEPATFRFGSSSSSSSSSIGSIGKNKGKSVPLEARRVQTVPGS